MYLVRTSEMTFESRATKVSSSVAESAEWLWEGRRVARARRQTGVVEGMQG